MIEPFKDAGDMWKGEPYEVAALRTHYVVNGNAMGWGRSDKTSQAAIRHMREYSAAKPTEYKVYLATAGTEVDGSGCITWPKGDPAPLLIKHIKNGRNILKQPRLEKAV